MNYEPLNDRMIRRFLLGDLTPAEQEDIEIRLLADAELQTAVEVAEFDLIDDYIRGDLSEVEVAGFERRFLISAERRNKVRTARAFLNSQAPPQTTAEPVEVSGERRGEVVKIAPNRKRREKSFGWRWSIPIAVGIILLIALGVLVRRAFFHSPVDQAVESLRKAYARERPVESRLSGFDHAPWTQRRGGEQQTNGYTLRDQAARTLLAEVNDHPDAKSRHALGSLYLLEGKIDEAVKQFEEALKTAPDNARIHNDLGAALMELGKTQSGGTGASEPGAERASAESLVTFGRANEHFARALKIDGNLNEALFNQALCLQRLGLIDQAIAAWRQYQQIDPNSEWANEARGRLADLEEQKKKTTRNRARLRQSFLAAYLDGDDERAWRLFGLSYEQTGNVITDQLLDEYLSLLAKGIEMRRGGISRC
jgi:tetratricopeptide (TPR) repeat protein